jgi:hypothetical protein
LVIFAKPPLARNNISRLAGKGVPSSAAATNLTPRLVHIHNFLLLLLLLLLFYYLVLLNAQSLTSFDVTGRCINGCGCCMVVFTWPVSYGSTSVTLSGELHA